MENSGWLTRQSDLFNTVIQCGAVLAVLFIFSNRIKSLFTDRKSRETRTYTAKLALAFLITGTGGLALKKLGLVLPKDPRPVAIATLVGGILILIIERALRGRKSLGHLSWTIAIAVGFAQLIAGAFPGTSRSGATILVAIAFGVSRPAATEFSFLVGIPTLLAAGALELVKAFRAGAPTEQWAFVLLGTLVSAVSAFIVVRWLLRYVQSHTFTPFGWYRIALGALILILARA